MNEFQKAMSVKILTCYKNQLEKGGEGSGKYDHRSYSHKELEDLVKLASKKEIGAITTLRILAAKKSDQVIHTLNEALKVLGLKEQK